MNKNTRNLLNWILIAMLVMLPLRGVMASVQTTCDMHDQASQGMEDHGMHMMHQMAKNNQMDTAAANDCCCCDGAMKCSNNCDMGISVSFIMQSVITVPVINPASLRTHVHNNLVFRDLAPPTRPPAFPQI